MKQTHLLAALGVLALGAGAVRGVAQEGVPVAITAQDPLAPIENKTPNVISNAGDVTTTLGSTVFINHGIVGVGRIAADVKDGFVPAETFGSISGLQITDWAKNGDGSYGGTFNILPDRGYNSGSFFSDYAARIQRVSFSFTPYTGAAAIGGVGIGGMIAAQNQILFTSAVSGTKFTYFDPIRGASSFTTGLDPDTGFATLFGKTVPYVTSYVGAQTPASVTSSTFLVNKLPLDAEALVLKGDGSGYIGDEYGADIYYFNASREIVGVIVTPAAVQPHHPSGTIYFNSINTPDNGRRNNQGIEGVSLSPDGTRLFALLQSGTVQDSTFSGSNQNRKQTRLLVYDVSANPTPASPVEEYALTLPTFRQSGKNNPVDTAAAQSEIVALDNTRLLVLSRDGNGLGNSGNNQSVFKSILLVDTRLGAPTNFANDAARNAEGGKITSSAGVLAAGITPLAWSEAVNMLNQTQLNKFNIQLYLGDNAQVSQLTLSEKWEGLSLVPALDPANPDDYFLFVGNDNDFLTSTGQMIGPDGSLVFYDGFSGYNSLRQPINGGAGSVNANDTLFIAFRVTLTKTPTVVRGGFVYDRATQRFAQQVSIQNTSASTLTGPIHLVLDNLSANASLWNASGTTSKLPPIGSPYITVVAAGVALAPGASATTVLQFTNPSRAGITYNTRALVLTGNPAP